MKWCILRDDGHYYLGTIDKNPVFGHGEAAAMFKKEAHARQRMKGLREQNPDWVLELEYQPPNPPPPGPPDPPRPPPRQWAGSE